MRKTVFTSMLAGLLLSFPVLMTELAAAANITIYPAPEGAELTNAYKITVGGHEVPVYLLRVAVQDKDLRIAAVEDKSQYGINFEKAAFAYFDADGQVEVSVTYNGQVDAARVLPAAAASQVKIEGSTIRFSANSPQNITLEVNHQLVRVLHLFINPLETNAPDPHAANVNYLAPGDHKMVGVKMPAGKTVWYFAPGMHTIDNLVVQDGQTVYIAGGAVIKSEVAEGADYIPSTYRGQTSKLYTQPAIKIAGSHVKFEGPGILDGTDVRGKRLLSIRGQDITLQDVILQNSGDWFMPIMYSDHVTVTNLKILGYRGNSDGIDVYSSRDVTIQGCFIRTVDDVVVIKSKPQKNDSLTEGDEVRNVLVEGNRFWNETGSDMKIGTEVGADISDVTFRDNDVIRDIARGAPIGIQLAGIGNITNIRFENNRVDRTGNPFDRDGWTRFVYMYVKASQWMNAADRDRALGKIRGVTISDTQITTSRQSPRIRIELQGADDNSDIEDVTFQNITVNGRPLSKANTVVEQKYANHIRGLP